MVSDISANLVVSTESTFRYTKLDFLDSELLQYTSI